MEIESETPDTPAPKMSESFAEKWQRHVESSGSSVDDGPDEDGEEAPPPAAESKPNGKADPGAPPTEREKKLEQLRSLATELGYGLDEKDVTIAERKAFREAKRKNQAWLEAERAKDREGLSAKEQELEKKHAEFAETVKWASELKASFSEARDYDARAKALGFPSWDAMIEDSVEAFSDPNYKRLKELERFKEEQLKAAEAAKAEGEKKTAAEREAQERAEADKRRAVATQQVLQGIQGDLSSSTDPVLQAFSDDTTLINGIFQLMQKNWDNATKSTVTVAQAVRLPLAGGKTLLELLRETHSRAIQRAHKAWGADVFPEDFRKKLGTPTPTPKKGAPLPPPKREKEKDEEEVPAGGGRDQFGRFRSEREWRENRFRQVMGEAIDEEKRAKRKSG